jgi:hypothetical protein
MLLWEVFAVSNETSPEPRRIAREKETIRAMIGLYCRGHHAPASGPCAECHELLDYAFGRLDRCRFGAAKGPCARCPVHCYKPAMRERVRQVMRYAGPRMLCRHPILALLHQLDGLRDRLRFRAARNP